MKEFNGERLKKARILRGLTLSDLASKTDVTRQAISLYENGSTSPGYEHGVKLAYALNVPYDFFFQEDKYPTSTKVTYFRSLLSTSKKDRTAQASKLEFVAEVYAILSDYISFPKPNIPAANFHYDEYASNYEEIGENPRENQEIEAIAYDLRKYWELGSGPNLNLQFTLEKNGVIVTGFDTNVIKIDAFSQKTLANGTELFLIAVDQGEKPEGRIRFDLAHELGHLILHPWVESIEMLSRGELKQIEKQANLFAGAFLMPAESFGQDVSAHPTDLGYYAWLKTKWHLSIQAMAYRARQLNIITNSQHQYMMRQISKRGWRKQEPGDSPYFLKPNIFQASVDLLFENRIMSASAFLNLLAEGGVTLPPDEIEAILHLRPGSLEIQEPSTNIIQLKPLKP